MNVNVSARFLCSVASPALLTQSIQALTTTGQEGASNPVSDPTDDSLESTITNVDETSNTTAGVLSVTWRIVQSSEVGLKVTGRHVKVAEGGSAVAGMRVFFFLNSGFEGFSR